MKNQICLILEDSKQMNIKSLQLKEVVLIISHFLIPKMNFSFPF